MKMYSTKLHKWVKRNFSHQRFEVRKSLFPPSFKNFLIERKSNDVYLCGDIR